MEITPGEFESFRTHATRTRRSDTRSSLRSDTSGSLEILPPEEGDSRLFMNEELSDEEESDKVSENVHISPGRRSKSSSRSTTVSSPYPTIFEDDPELERLIKKMKKYDRLLQESAKKEKEVKLQRLLFQKQMLDELNKSDKSEDKLATNENKFLALMPPPERLQDMLVELQREEQTNIFQTETIPEDSSTDDLGASRKSEDDSSEKSKKTESDFLKSGVKKKIDFIRRNIELAKDAGNYMTDEEKVRLNELLSDLDEITDTESMNIKEAFGQLSLVGQGYTPDEEDRQRLAEIDEKIQSLVPESEFLMICGTPHLSARGQDKDKDFGEYFKKPEFKPAITNAGVTIEEVQKRLEDLDGEWRKTFEGTTPRLSDEQLQRLLDECSGPRSSVNSSLSLRTLTESRTSFDDYRPSSQSTITSSQYEVHSERQGYDADSEHELNLSIAEKLPSETLDLLLNQARASLGLPASDTLNTSTDDEAESCQLPVFQRVELAAHDDSHSGSKHHTGEELNLEDV